MPFARRLALLSLFTLPLTIGCGSQIAENCEVRYEDVCYPSGTEACAAANCPAERCIILESYPGQVECQAEASGDEDVAVEHPNTPTEPTPEPPPACGAYGAGGACFATPEEACDSLNCDGDCLFLESYPVQVQCEG